MVKYIIRCFKCRFVDFREDYNEVCPLCGSHDKTTLMHTNIITKEIQDYFSASNKIARTNYLLWGKKGLEKVEDPYSFYLSRSCRKDIDLYNIHDEKKIFLRIYERINNKNIFGKDLKAYLIDIHLMFLRLVFYSVELDKIEICEKKINAPLDWAIKIIKENVRVVLRDIKNNVKRTSAGSGSVYIYDLYINPRLLGYLEMVYLQGLLTKDEYGRRQKILLELIDLYRDYSKFDKECEELYQKCMGWIYG